MSDMLMHFTDIDPPSVSSKDEERQEIAAQVREYQARGGRIQVIPSELSTIDMASTYQGYGATYSFKGIR